MSTSDPFNIIGLLCWHDESPAWLAATIASMAPHIDHLVAVDGAYVLYPEGKAWSPPDQHEIIMYSCQAHDIGLTLHTPSHVWIDNEVEKRGFMMKLGVQASESARDWLWVMDSDEVVIHYPPDTRDRLAATDLNVAEITYYERHPEAQNPKATAFHSHWGAPGTEGRVRKMFRALPDLTQGHNHYTVYGAGERLWGNSTDGQQLTEALDLLDLTIDHRTHFRAKHRHDAQYTYYRRRDENNVEAGKCDICGAPATHIATQDWEMVNSEGKWQLAAGWREVCAGCKAQADEEADAEVKALTNGQASLTDMKVTQGKLPNRPKAPADRN